MFVKILDQVTDQNKKECQHCRYIDDYLSNAIKIWCHQLEISKEITNYILRGYQIYEIKELTNYVYNEWQQEKKKEEKNWLSQVVHTIYEKSRLNSLIVNIFNLINMGVNNMKIIALIAFIITAVGYWIYKINHKKEQPEKQQQFTHRTEVKQYESVSYV
ncbi:MAG: hypothetical protein WBA39_01215, partial [Rivularia sp. (in: cyanobacteria)]